MSDAQNGSGTVADGQSANGRISWTSRIFLTNIVLIIAAILSAYLEYVAYRKDLVSELETHIGLRLSFLTYQYDAIRGSTQIIGLPAFDFFQAIVYLAIIINIWHFLRVGKRRS